MDTKTNISCTVLIIWLFSIAFFIFTPYFLNEIQETNSFLGANNFTPSIVTTLEPSSTKSLFIVEKNEVMYGHTDTLNCQRVISGRINYTSREKIGDIAIAVELREDSGNKIIGHFLPGTDLDYGATGWSIVVPNDSLYIVWLQQISTGEILSPQVPIETQNCENNLVIVNFMQVLPMS